MIGTFLLCIALLAASGEPALPAPAPQTVVDYPQVAWDTTNPKRTYPAWVPADNAFKAAGELDDWLFAPSHLARFNRVAAKNARLKASADSDECQVYTSSVVDHRGLSPNGLVTLEDVNRSTPRLSAIITETHQGFLNGTAGTLYRLSSINAVGVIGDTDLLAFLPIASIRNGGFHVCAWPSALPLSPDTPAAGDTVFIFGSPVERLTGNMTIAVPDPRKGMIAVQRNERFLVMPSWLPDQLDTDRVEELLHRMIVDATKHGGDF